MHREMASCLQVINSLENCELHLTCGPHLPGTVPFTGSVAVPPGRDLLMQLFPANLRNASEKKNILYLTMDLIKAKPEDVEILEDISRRTFYEAFNHLNKASNMEAYMNKAFNRDKLFSELQNQNSEFYFAKVDGQIAGYMKLNRNDAQSEFKDPDSIEIERIYVDRQFQNARLGSMMLAKAREMALMHGCRYLWLGVWEHNPNAIRFYEKNGFSAFSSHEFIMGDEVQMDRLMICKLQ